MRRFESSTKCDTESQNDVLMLGRHMTLIQAEPLANTEETPSLGKKDRVKPFLHDRKSFEDKNFYI